MATKLLSVKECKEIYGLIKGYIDKL